ncbi:hypothetical protein GGF31_008614, partial [Allomyces arbusculus]
MADYAPVPPAPPSPTAPLFAQPSDGNDGSRASSQHNVQIDANDDHHDDDHADVDDDARDEEALLPASRLAAAAAAATTSSRGLFDQPMDTLKNRTPLERVLLGSSLALFVACAVLLALYAGQLHQGNAPIPHVPVADDPITAPPSNGPNPVPVPIPAPVPPIVPKDPKNDKAEFCLTPGCTLAAAHMLESMNPAADPCDDFYQYACGGWEQKHDLPDNKQRVGVFNDLDDANKRIIRAILDSPAPPASGNGKHRDLEQKLFDQVRTVFRACMDEPAIAARGAQPLRDAVATVTKTFPADLESVDRAKLAGALAQLHFMGIDTLVAVGVTDDSHDPKRQIVNVWQAGLGLPSKEFFEESKYTQVYERAIAGMLKSLFDGQVDAVPAAEVDEETDADLEDGDGLLAQWLTHFGFTKREVPVEPVDLAPVERKVCAEGQVANDDGSPCDDPFWDWFWDIFFPQPKHPKPEPPKEPKEPKKPKHPKEPKKPKKGKKPKHPPVEPEPEEPQEPVPEVPTKPAIDWTELAKSVVALEQQIAVISWNNEDLSNPIKTYNPMTVADLEAKIPVLPWKSLISQLTRTAKLPCNDVDACYGGVVVGQPSYLEKLDALLSKASPRTVHWYLVWRTVQSLAEFTDPATQKPLEEYRAVVNGIAPGTRPPRADTCLAVVDSTVGMSAGRWFVAKQFGGNARKRAQNVIGSILDAFDERLDELAWLDDATRTEARRKAKALDRKVGYPDLVMNVTQLHDKYAPLTVNREDHFGNMVRAARVQFGESWQKLPKPTDYKSWEMTPQMVNAYYSPTHNEIVFPAGILQPPFFFPGDVPDALAYGAIGVVAGHELAHAFDHHGRLYDSEGRLVDWWSEHTAAEFDKRAQCFVEHYGNFSIVDPQGRKLHVNGKLTL